MGLAVLAVLLCQVFLVPAVPEPEVSSSRSNVPVVKPFPVTVLFDMVFPDEKVSTLIPEPSLFLNVLPVMEFWFADCEMMMPSPPVLFAVLPEIVFMLEPLTISNPLKRLLLAMFPFSVLPELVISNPALSFVAELLVNVLLPSPELNPINSPVLVFEVNVFPPLAETLKPWIPVLPIDLFFESVFDPESPVSQ
jgi:hypothetical protein